MKNFDQILEQLEDKQEKQILSMVNKLWEDFSDHTEMVLNALEAQKQELVKCIINITAVEQILIDKGVFSNEEIQPYLNVIVKQLQGQAEEQEPTDNSLDDLDI